MSDIDQFLHEVTAQLKMFGKLWDNFATCAYTLYGNMGDDTELECPSIKDVKITPVDQSDTRNFLEEKRMLQKINKSTMANPGAQTSAKKPCRRKNLSISEATLRRINL
ncbi:hypothetical protein RhiirA5_435459 [Rhizophagus irregularis]|uniref:Uncharacterized protein n=1 Tax=Rhizophagus irregularis TaxID=588596 RepID=A0A2I1ERM5_9GLOM|nr:hypothetical protein RhiirA5_435459 [Rhizophagus irregularis]PKC54395.1 hypothetical protein RhiirA1_477393 [Rhizophagus irregularis]PKY24767.1 hypothetical protein RhiirB3_439453 [Rhizophagus irregularis]